MNSAGKSSHHHHHRYRHKQPGAKGSSHNHKSRSSKESHSTGTNSQQATSSNLTSSSSSSLSGSSSSTSSKRRDHLTEENILIQRLISYYYNLHRLRKGEKSSRTMATKGGCADEVDTSKNFLRQFRDKNSRQLKKFSATQFMEVWNHYDSDGE